MKRLFFIGCLALAAAGCNNAATDSTPATADSTTAAAAEKIDYPYSPTEPYKNWQPGSQQHVVTVMKALKAFETGDIANSTTYFADTVDLRFDAYRARVSNDSLQKLFSAWRGRDSTIKVEMHDWESVVSADKKEEWVTMWYKQVWTDKKGKTDSASIVNDCKIVNGKIAVLDEKLQRFPAGKK